MLWTNILRFEELLWSNQSRLAVMGNDSLKYQRPKSEIFDIKYLISLYIGKQISDSILLCHHIFDIIIFENKYLTNGSIDVAAWPLQVSSILVSLHQHIFLVVGLLLLLLWGACYLVNVALDWDFWGQLNQYASSL